MSFIVLLLFTEGTDIWGRIMLDSSVCHMSASWQLCVLVHWPAPLSQLESSSWFGFCDLIYQPHQPQAVGGFCACVLGSQSQCQVWERSQEDNLPGRETLLPLQEYSVIILNSDVSWENEHNIDNGLGSSLFFFLLFFLRKPGHISKKTALAF